MSIASDRTATVTLTGDITADYSFQAQPNTNSPGLVTGTNLVSGSNTITLPGTTTYQVRAATIVPPTDNEQTITLKGVSGDTGIPISRIDPTTVTFDTTNPPVSFVLTAGGTVSAVRIIWS